MRLPSSSDLLLIDPSLLLSEQGSAWLEDDESARHEIIVSRALADSLRGGGADIDLSRFVAPEDESGLPDRVERLLAYIENVETFSYRDVDLPAAEAQVRDSLLNQDQPNGELLADEWTFLVTNSWMASKLHYALDKFRDGGAGIVEYGRRLRDEMISVVVPNEHVPAALSKGFLLKVEVKWLIVGGTSAAGFFFPPAAVAGPLAVPILRAFDP